MGVAFTSPLILGQNPPPNLVSLVNSYSFFKSQLKSPQVGNPSPLWVPSSSASGQHISSVARLPPDWGHSITPHRAAYMGDSEEPTELS